MSLKEKLKKSAKVKQFTLWCIQPARRPRPRLWIRLFINPFFHKKGKHSLIRRRTRIDVFPYNRFQLGDLSTIEDFCTINNGAGNVIIGNKVRVGIGTVIIGPVEIGNGSGTGQHVFISGFNHSYNDGEKNSSDQGLDIKGVAIEEDVHIGANSVIVAGIRIGKRSQIGASSVVTKDIPPFSVAVGNPARIIKTYYEELGLWEKYRENN